MDLKNLYYSKFILGLWRWPRGLKHLLEKSDKSYNSTQGITKSRAKIGDSQKPWDQVTWLMQPSEDPVSNKKEQRGPAPEVAL